MEKRIYLSVLLITLVGIFFRFYQLGKIPVSLNWDEVSIGYNSYSLWKTGRDEFGVKYPIFIESFGDFKSAFPSYLTIPFIKYLGLNELSVRLPTALMSIVIILSTFYLSKLLTKNVNLSLTATLLISLSPWAIHFARFSNEATVALAFSLCGLIFWFKNNENIFFTILSSLFLSLSMYIYHNVRIFIPLYLITLILIEGNLLNKRIQKKLGIFFVSMLLFLIPFLLSFRTFNPISRAKAVSIFNHKEYIDQIMESYFKYDVLHIPFKRVFNNKLIFYSNLLLKKYLEHYSVNFLFLSEAISPRLGITQVGKIYLIELPFLIYGLIKLLLSKDRKLFLIISSWLILAPLASTLTYDSPHSLRAMLFLPILQIISAYGFIHAYRQIKNLKGMLVANSFGMFTFGLLIFSFIYYLNFYYLYYPEQSALYWQDGYKELFRYINPIKNNYQNIIVSNYSGQPHIFFAFWTKYSPTSYQEQRIKQGKSLDIIKLDNLVFKEIGLKDDLCNANDLIVTSPHAIDKYIKPIKIIYLFNRFGGNIPVFDVSEIKILATSSAFLNEKICTKSTKI